VSVFACYSIEIKGVSGPIVDADSPLSDPLEPLGFPGVHYGSDLASRRYWLRLVIAEAGARQWSQCAVSVA
jgi:hypothetical protein